MWKTPLTTSTLLDLEGIGSERVEFGPHGDRLFRYRKFDDPINSGEMLEDIGVTVVSQSKDSFGWVQYQGYCPFAKILRGESNSNVLTASPGLGFIENVPTVSIGSTNKKEKGVFDILDYEKTNKAVETLFGRRWRANAKRNNNNNPDMIESGLKEYSDTLYNKPVILIGAGPSLKKNIKHLKRTKITKVAMLHALPILEKEGIKVDFVVHSDAMSDDSVFITKSSRDITLLANVIVAPAVLRKWGGDIRYFGGIAGTKLAYDITKITNVDSQITPMGCSMGAALWIFDKIFNAQDFIFIGNDLSFSEEGDTHCWDGQSVSTHEIAGINHFAIKDDYMGKVYETCYQFVLYKHNIENYTRDRQRTTNKRFVNATEGGILCLNETMTFPQAIKEFNYARKTESI